MTPCFALSRVSSLKLGETGDLQTHLTEILALEALVNAATTHRDTTSSWKTSVSKKTNDGAISFAAFRGKIAANPDTGLPEPEMAVERNLGLHDYRAFGLLDELDDTDEAWQGDDIALGVNFSRLHRVARVVEHRAPELLRTLKGRIDEDMRATDMFTELEEAAERRRRREREEEKKRYKEWLEEQQEHERLAEQKRENDQAAALEFKRMVAKLFDVKFETELELDCKIELNTNKTTKGYENAFKKPMPHPWARNGPFIWARIQGFENRVFFDADSNLIPAPS